MGAFISRSALIVCEPIALRNLCASSHTKRSGFIAATLGPSRLAVSYDITSTGQRSKELLESSRGSTHHRSHARSTASAFPSASDACTRMSPSHFLNSAPQFPMSDAGQIKTARRHVGFPRGPCVNIVHKTARTCNDLPKPISSANKTPRTPSRPLVVVAVASIP